MDYPTSNIPAYGSTSDRGVDRPSSSGSMPIQVETRTTPQWTVTMLSPSPSPEREMVQQSGGTLYKQLSRSPSASSNSPRVEMPILPRDPTPPHPRTSLPLIYRSTAPQLPRLETKNVRELYTSPVPQHRGLTPMTTSPRRATSRSSLPCFERPFYPTPLSVTERERRIRGWPSAQAEYHPPRVFDDINYEGYRHPIKQLPSRFDSPVSQRHPDHPFTRPVLAIRPFAAPSDPKYYSAGGYVQRPRHVPPMLHLEERRHASPASAVASPGFKAPRKRADESQLSILSEVFERTAYPPTEERDDLARRLGMTSRSVQIWFQNRRRAVKVEEISARQRIEADMMAVRGGMNGGPSNKRQLTPTHDQRGAWGAKRERFGSPQ